MGILLNKSKNYVINGAMDFWQRGTSFAAIADSTYSVDRWRYSKSGAMVHTLSQSSDVPTLAQSGFNFTYSTRLNLTTPDASLAAGDQCELQQRIEGNIFAPLRGKTITFSFWVKATLAGLYTIGFSNGASNRSIVKAYAINSSNTWERKSVTILHDDSGTWDYSTGLGLIVRFSIANGTTRQAPALDVWASGNYAGHSTAVNGVNTGATDFYITGVQLEEGVSSSNFERAGGNFLNEVQLCQRYFQKNISMDDLNSAPSSFYITRTPGSQLYETIPFKVTMRTAPTIVGYNSLTFAAGTWRNTSAGTNVTFAANNINQNSFATQIASGFTAGDVVAGNWTADAEL